jgi:hypothetical protein
MRAGPVRQGGLETGVRFSFWASLVVGQAVDDALPNLDMPDTPCYNSQGYDAVRHQLELLNWEAKLSRARPYYCGTGLGCKRQEESRWERKQNSRKRPLRKYEDLW